MLELDVKKIACLILSVIFLGLAMFTGFVPFEWVCEFLGVKTCQIHHGAVVSVSLALFLAAIVAAKQFDFHYIFMARGS